MSKATRTRCWAVTARAYDDTYNGDNCEIRVNDFRFLAGGNAVIQGRKDRGDGVTKATLPVEGSSLCCGAAIGIHPVHAVLCH